MNQKHHLLQLTPNRANSALQRLLAEIWHDECPVSVEASEPTIEQVSLMEAKQLNLTAVAPCSFWGRLFDQRWCLVTLPAVSDANTWLHWQDQGEATLYIEDQPYYGFNVAHRYCRLPEGVKEVWVQSSCIQSAIWHPQANGMKSEGSFFEKAFVARRDEDAWHAYHDLKCLFDLVLDQRHRENPQVPITLNGSGVQAPLGKFSPVLRVMFRGIENALDAYDREGAAALSNCLSTVYQSLRQENVYSRCILTGHAHLDLVWIWPERMGELKAVNVFATANRLLEEYPEFRFAYSQPASYEAVAKREPGFFQDTVLDRIKSGRWEATGAMYVESDTILPCGEALARSFMLGQEGFVELGGKPSRLTWLPDVFGYSACLPQIMAQVGVDYFFTTKMTWNAINRFPYSSFIWRGHDGSEVLAHVTQDSGYVTHMSVDNVKAPMDANQQADVYDEFLLPTGYGDGGGGATDEMIERAHRLDRLPGMPAIQWDQPEAFFERLNQVRDELPVHQGECYLEYHRGTYTTHGNLKAIFRNLERALQLAEAVSARTGKNWEMTYAWKRLVFAQFHDYIPGSSVWDVYLEGLPELDALAQAQTQRALEALSTENGKVCLFNPHAVEVKTWFNPGGTDEDIYVSLPPLSGSYIEEVKTDAPTRVEVQDRTVSNGLVTFRVNSSGWIDQLEWEGISLPLREPLGQLILYPDHASTFEAWDIDRHVLTLGDICDAQAEISPFVEGAHRAGLQVRRAVGENSSATVSFALEAGSPLVHVSVDLDWQEPEHLLKLFFPTRYCATNARFGIPFGSVIRPQIPNGLVAEAMWEVPFSRFLAVFDEGEHEGLFVVSESKYGASVREGNVGISLVRSPRVTGCDELHGAAWPRHLSRLKLPSSYSDIGDHFIRLAVGRYDSSLPRERHPASLADTLFTPALSYTGQRLPPVIQSMEGGESLIPCWVKPADNGGWTMRLHEVAGRRGLVTIRTLPGWNLSRTTLSEEGDAPCSSTLVFSPYEVVSLRLTLDI